MSVMYLDSSQQRTQYGVHIPFRQSFLKTAKAAIKLDGWCSFQTYIVNERGRILTINPRDVFDASQFLSLRNRRLYIHDNLRHNFCGYTDPKKDCERVLAYYVSNLAYELDVAAMLGTGVVIHPGSCKDPKIGISRISQALQQACTMLTPITRSCAQLLDEDVENYLKRRCVYLENSAGEGNKVAAKLSDLSEILRLTLLKPIPGRIRVCLDTAHLTGYGYDLSNENGVRKLLDELDTNPAVRDAVGLIHLNDSAVPCGSHVDRHAPLGTGYVWRESSSRSAFELFISAFSSLDFIDETPDPLLSRVYLCMKE